MSSVPGPAYELQRSENTQSRNLDCSTSVADSESYLGIQDTTRGEASVAGHYHATSQADATDVVHEVHLALLYLLSNPDEFQRALAVQPARGATTLSQWNAEYDAESLLTDADSVSLTNTAEPVENSGPTPLPFVVFADDAEVVLPQAHTASQLFGVERLEGIELEAAAGISAISQLFLRWLGTFCHIVTPRGFSRLWRTALMPGGDHIHIIDPPGLTVMRIAGGRYRVTAAHRVVWTWMNEFAPLGSPRPTAGSKPSLNVEERVDQLQVGDLVSMTVVDVFETDNQGRLLSYCPTFDNRAIHKTNQTTESLRKGGSQLLSILGKAKNSKIAGMIAKNAKSVAKSVKEKVDSAVYRGGSSEEKKAQDIRNAPSHEQFGEV